MAAIVEQHNDEHGIRWPASVAPYDVHLVALAAGNAEVSELAENVAAELDEAGLDVLLDDRDLRPGEKFADADLLGMPWRVTVGRKSLDDGLVDVRARAAGDDTRVSQSEIAKLTHQS